MPWSVGDVDEHKKGLSDEQKSRWVAIANSALKSCMSKGGSDEECAASAIRQANGVVGHSEYEHYSIHKNKQDPNYAVQEKIHQGKNHMVVPVVMMVEGVHHGSHGPMLHLIDELGRFPEMWNGIPIVINHPEVDGMNVSANSPDIIEQSIGRVYNTHVDGSRLAAELWIETEKLRLLSVEVLENLQKGIPLEVSLGMFTEDEPLTGDWNGEPYEAIARNHRPDHLALLPGGVGACSMKDGCGIRANSNNAAEGSGFKRTKVNININPKEVIKMAENVVCPPCIKTKVDALLANKQGKFTEDDRPWMETLSEPQLDKLVPTVIEVEKTVEVNVLSDEDKQIIADYKRQKAEKRTLMVQTIQTNLGKETWTDDVLATMKDDVLEKVVGLVNKKKVVDYSLNGGGSNLQENECKEEPLPPTGIKFKTNK